MVGPLRPLVGPIGVYFSSIRMSHAINIRNGVPILKKETCKVMRKNLHFKIRLNDIQNSSKSSAGLTNNIEDQTATLEGANKISHGLTTLAVDSTATTTDASIMLHEKMLALNPYERQGLDKVLGRMNKIRFFNWSTADASGTLIATIKVPEDLFQPPQGTLKNEPLLGRLSGYRYFRSGVKLRVTVNCTAFNAGKLMFTWMPYHSTDASTYQYKSHTMYQASCNRPMILDVPASDTLEIDIPWVTPNVWLDLQRYADVALKPFWTSYIAAVQLWVLHPLQNVSASAPNPSKVNVTIEAAFTNAEVSGYMPLAYLSPVTVDAINQSFEEVNKSARGVVAGVAQLKTHVQEALSTIPIVGGVLSETLGSVAGGFGFDKPTTVASTERVDLQLAPDMCFGEGLDNSNKLALLPTNRVATDPSIFSQKFDEMDIYRIARTPSLRFVGSLDTSSAAGSIIHTEMIDPMRVSPELSVNGPFASTFLAWITYPFTFWSGSIKYFLQFTCPKMISAKLRISYTPGELTSTSQLDFLGGEFASRIIDIKGSTQTQFTVPFLSQYAALPVKRFLRKASETHSDFNTLGFWTISVVNPIVAGTTAGKIDFAIWIAAGEDYRLYKPRDITPNISNLAVSSSIATEDDEFEDLPLAVNQGSEMKSGASIWDFFGSHFEPLIPSSYILHDKLTCGENVSSLRTLMHRYTFVKAYNGNISTATTETVVFLGSQTATGTVLNNIHAYFLHLFYYWRGSLRFKLINKSSGFGYGKVVHTFGNTPVAIPEGLPNNAFFGATLYNSAYKPSCEWEMPYYHMVPFVTVLPPNGTTTVPPKDDLLVIPRITITRQQNTDAGVATGGPSFDMYFAVGDDFSAGFLSAPPIITEDIPV